MSAAAVETAPLRCAIYARLSMNRDGKSTGVEEQERLCRELTDRLGWEVRDEHVLADDDISAYSGKRRPAYEQLLALIETDQIDALAIYNTDRLYRRIVDLGPLTELVKRHRIEIRTITSGDVDLTTADGRMNAGIKAVVAEHESARIGERVKMKHASNARAGKAHGGLRPYGYRRLGEGRLEVVAEEAAVIRWLAERVLAGATARSLAVELNRRGTPSPHGGHWVGKSVKRALTSPRVAGLVPSGGDGIGEAGWEPILDRATWERCHSLLDHARPGRPPTASLLAGMLRCGSCGGPMTGQSRGGGERAYSCTSVGRRDRCEYGPKIAAHLVEGHVAELVIEAARGTNLARVRAERSVTDTARLAAEVAADEALLNELAADMGERRISRGEWVSARGPVEARLKANRATLASLGGGDGLPEDLVAMDEARWDGLTFDGKRALIRLYVEHITVLSAGGRRVPVAERVRVSWKA